MINRIVVDVSHVDPIVAAGLAVTLGIQPDFDVETVGSDSPRRFGPTQVIVTDYVAGLGMVADLRRRGGGSDPLPAVLIVSLLQRELEIRRALEAGVRGYLLIGCAFDELVCAVRSLSAGMRHIDSNAARLLADSIAREALTPREEEVLGLLVEGLGNKAVARNLDISVGTVKSHLRSIYGKLDATSRTEAVTFAERRGLFEYAALPRARGRIVERLVRSPGHLPFCGTASSASAST